MNLINLVFYSKKHPLFIYPKNKFDFYNFKISYGTLMYFEQLLIKNNIKYDKNVIKYSLRNSFIISFKRFSLNLYLKNETELEINSVYMKNLLNEELKINIIDNTLLVMLKNDYISLIEHTNETFFKRRRIYLKSGDIYQDVC